MKRLSILLTLVILTTGPILGQKSSSFKWLRNVDEQIVRPYSNGLSAYFENGKWGFLDIDGKVVIKPIYDEVNDFKDNYCIAKKDGKWGVIDIRENQLFPFVFESITPFVDGIALADEGALKSYLYLNGKRQVLSNKYEFYPYSEGMARIRSAKNGKWGYIDKEGIIVLNPRYDTAEDFRGGVALVSRNYESYLINTKGDKKSTSFHVDTTLKMSAEGVGYIKAYDGKYHFINSKLEPFGAPFNLIHPFSEGIALVRDKMNYLNYISPEGKLLFILKEFDEAGDFSEGKAWVMKNGKYGYVNTRGDLIVDTLFSYASNFKNNRAYVAIGQRQGVIKMAERNEKYPNMTFANIRVIDSNNNGTVEAEEHFTIEVEVENSGDDVLNSAKVVLGGNSEQSSWFSYDAISSEISAIPAGEKRTVTFTGVANTTLLSEDIALMFRGEASNLFSSVQMPFSFAAAGINACKPVIESYWAHHEDHSPLSPGKEAVLMLTVKNEGKDRAKDVTVSLQWPENIKFNESILRIPYLEPDETKTLSTYFTIEADTLYSTENSDFSLVARVDEFTHQREEIKYLSFSSGKLNSQINLLTGAGAMMQMNYAQMMPEKKVAKKSELLIGLHPVATPSEKRFALVIGNEDYNGGKRDATYQPNVEFAEQDATAFARYAEDMMGVPNQNIILLKNATYAQMKQNLSKIERVAKQNPGEIELIVYYAGHGQIDGDSKESYLIPVDVSITAPTAGIKLEEFYSTLSSCSAKKTIVFLDACYSGVGRGIIIRPKETPIKGNLIVMTATSSSQRSMPYQEKGHGLFTYFLLKTMKDANGDISIGELYNQVSSTVKTNSIWINNMEQTPELINGPDIASGWKEWKF